MGPAGSGAPFGVHGPGRAAALCVPCLCEQGAGAVHHDGAWQLDGVAAAVRQSVRHLAEWPQHL